jgi:hypothetical protein
MGFERRLFGILTAALVLAAGCAKDDVEQARQRPESAPQAPPPSMGSSGPNDGHALALKTTGSNSAAELARDRPKLGDEAAATKFERAFRLTFAADASKRDYVEANRILQEVQASHPEFAPAYRTRGYALFNINAMDPAPSLAEYEKAVALDSEYGEAHYAIAFMCAATGDLQKGVGHYRKAMALGVADERGIGQRFYADLLKTQ